MQEITDKLTDLTRKTGRLPTARLRAMGGHAIAVQFHVKHPQRWQRRCANPVRTNSYQIAPGSYDQRRQNAFAHRVIHSFIHRLITKPWSSGKHVQNHASVPLGQHSSS